MKNKARKFKSIIHLEAGDCRWPIGDPKHPDFHFCGAHQVPGRPYCAHHWPLSFDAAKPRGSAGAVAFSARRAA